MEKCTLCNDETEEINQVTEKWLYDAIKKDHPEWVENTGACPKCMEYYSNLGGDLTVKG